VRTPAVLGALGALVFAPTAYATLRLASARLFPEPRPEEVLWSLHSGFVWRALTAAYVAALVGAAVAFVARHYPDTVIRALVPGAIVGAALLLAQGLLVP
jgi:hypothetical protein